MKRIPYFIAAGYTAFLVIFPFVSMEFREKLSPTEAKFYFFVGLPAMFFIILFSINSSRGLARRLSRKLAERIIKSKIRRSYRNSREKETV
jgi:hypothetical protein